MDAVNTSYKHQHESVGIIVVTPLIGGIELGDAANVAARQLLCWPKPRARAIEAIRLGPKITDALFSRCRQWVRLGSNGMSALSLLDPNEEALARVVARSVWCHERTKPSRTSPTEFDPDPRHDAPLALAPFFRVTPLTLTAKPEADADADFQSGLLRLPDHFFAFLARLLTLDSLLECFVAVAGVIAALVDFGQIDSPVFTSIHLPPS